MTGCSNSATTSRMMWMLSASSARRWSSRNSVVTSGDKATVDISIRPSLEKEKARDLVPGFDPSAFSRVFSGSHPNSWTASAGTLGVLIQQQAQGQQVGRTTVPRFYLKTLAVYRNTLAAFLWVKSRLRDGKPGGGFGYIMRRLTGTFLIHRETPMTPSDAAPTTLLGLLTSIPADRTAIIIPEQNIRITYGALRRQVVAVAETLAARGIGRGDRVGMALPNGLPAIVAFLAASEAGTAAPLNPGYKEDEFRFYLEDTNARVLLLPPDGAADARRAAAERVPVLSVEMDAAGTVTVGGASGGPAQSAVEGPAPSVVEGRPYAAPTVDDTALILHTSGSTGRPKRVPLKHLNLSISARNVAESYMLTPDDVSLCVMPLFHVHGLVASTLATLATAGTVIVPGKFNPLSFWRVARDHGATWYSAVPTLHQLLLARAEPGASRPAGAEKLRFIRSCSAALAPQVMHDLEAAFGAPVLEAYGMTEAAHQMASNPLPPGDRKPGSVGPGTDVRISIMEL